MQTTSRLVAIQTVQVAVLRRRALEALKAAYLAELARGSEIAATMLLKLVSQ